MFFLRFTRVSERRKRIDVVIELSDDVFERCMDTAVHLSGVLAAETSRSESAGRLQRIASAALSRNARMCISGYTGHPPVGDVDKLKRASTKRGQIFNSALQYDR